MRRPLPSGRWPREGRSLQDLIPGRDGLTYQQRQAVAAYLLDGLPKGKVGISYQTLQRGLEVLTGRREPYDPTQRRS